MHAIIPIVPWRRKENHHHRRWIAGSFPRSKEKGEGVVRVVGVLSFGFHGWGKLQAEKDQDIISVLRMA
jgi:hypothetical protein